MNHASCLRRGSTLLDRPRTRLLRARRQIRLQTKCLIASLRKLLQTRRLNASVSEHLCRIVLINLNEFSFELHIEENRLGWRYEFAHLRLHGSVGQRGPSAEKIAKTHLEVAQAADEIGVNNASFRVHHFVPRASAPMPLLGAVAATTNHIEVGTGVVVMR